MSLVWLMGHSLFGIYRDPEKGDRNRGGTAMGAGDQPETKNSKVGH